MDEQLKRDAHLLCEKIRQLTLELDMSFHESIDEANSKYIEMQKV